MIRVCYSKFHVGNRTFGEKEPLEDKRLTHGICPDCSPREIEDVKRQMEEIRKEEGK